MSTAKPHSPIVVEANVRAHASAYRVTHPNRAADMARLVAYVAEQTGYDPLTCGRVLGVT